MQCSISECRQRAVRTVRIGFREKRNLCKRHYELFVSRDEAHPARFTRASEI